MRSIRFSAAAVALVTTAAMAVAASPASADPQTSSGSIGSIQLDATYSDTTVSPGDFVSVTLDFTNVISTPSNAATYTLGNKGDIGSVFVFDSCTIPAGITATCGINPGGNLSVAVQGLPSGTTTIEAVLEVKPDAASGDYPFRHDLFGTESGVLLNPALVVTVAPAAPAEADLAVALDASAPPLGSQISYDLSAANQGPGDVASATLVVDLPTQVSSVSNLPAGCSYSSASDEVTCTTGAIANGTSYAATFSANLGLLTIGGLPATATRTASSPTDPNAANDTSAASCTAVTSLVIIC